MLCREVVSHQRVVEDRHADESLPAGPWKASSAGRKTAKHATVINSGSSDESHGLTAQQRPVGFGAVGEPRTAQTMADPEQRSQPEIEGIERASLRIGVSVRQPECDRHEPERVEHPHAIPDRTAHPGR